MDKLVSILIPSRKRHHGLANTIRSLIKKADDPSRIEILIRLDRDDTSSIIWWSEHKKEFGEFCRVFAGDRVPGGYKNLHMMYNELALRADGTYLFVFNDDLLMVTDGYDTEISNFSDRIAILKPRWNHRSWNTFPIVHRAIVENNDILSPHVHIDRWLDYFAEEAGIHMEVNIQLDHVGDTDRRAYGTRGDFPDLHFLENGTHVNQHDSINRAEIQQLARKFKDENNL